MWQPVKRKTKKINHYFSIVNVPDDKINNFKYLLRQKGRFNYVGPINFAGIPCQKYQISCKTQEDLIEMLNNIFSYYVIDIYKADADDETGLSIAEEAKKKFLSVWVNFRGNFFLRLPKFSSGHHFASSIEKVWADLPEIISFLKEKDAEYQTFYATPEKKPEKLWGDLSDSDLSDPDVGEKEDPDVGEKDPDFGEKEDPESKPVEAESEPPVVPDPEEPEELPMGFAVGMTDLQHQLQQAQTQLQQSQLENLQLQLQLQQQAQAQAQPQPLLCPPLYYQHPQQLYYQPQPQPQLYPQQLYYQPQPQLYPQPQQLYAFPATMTMHR